MAIGPHVLPPSRKSNPESLNGKRRLREDDFPSLPAKDSLAKIQGGLYGFARPRVLQDQGAWYLFRGKGKLSRLGFYCIHLSILIILLGAMIGPFSVSWGYVNIVEGETVDRVFLRSGSRSSPGFQSQADQFSVSFYPTGAPGNSRAP
jgi:cytochrome c biogenesis protein